VDTLSADLLALSRRQGDVFSARQAVEHGCGPEEIRRLLDQQTIASVRQSIYCLTPLLEGDPVVCHRIRCAAALLAHGNPAADGQPTLAVGALSAAVLWRITVPLSLRQLERRPKVTRIVSGGSARTPWMPTAVHLVSGDRTKRAYRDGVRISPAALTPLDIAYREGIPVTTAARTAIDLCRRTPVWHDALIVVDSTLRRGLGKAELCAAADRAARWPGGSMGVRAAKFGDARAESPAESVARALFAQHSALRDYDLQVRIADSDGYFAKVDFLFRAHRTIVEVDGKVKYDDPWGTATDVLWDEKLREDRLRDLGYEVVRVTWEQLITRPERVVERVLAAFARADRRAA